MAPQPGAASLFLLALALGLAACAPTEHVYLARPGERDALTVPDGAPPGGDSAGAAETSAAGTSRLCLSPASLDFGVTPPGSSRSRSLRIATCGDAPVTLRSATVDGPGFALEAPPVLPRTLAPGAALTYVVRFAPQAAGPAEGTLRLDAAGRDETPFAAAIPLAGVAGAGG